MLQSTLPLQRGSAMASLSIQNVMSFRTLAPPSSGFTRPSRTRIQSHDDASTSGGTASDDAGFQFTYQGSDGRLKATFEQAFKASGDKPTSATSSAPWELGYQMSEKNLAWNEDLKSRLKYRVVAQQMDISDADMEDRVEQLTTLLPDLKAKLPYMHPVAIQRLLESVDALPMRLIELKSVFPGADVAKLAMREPELVLGFDPDHLRDIASQLKEMFPRLNIDRLVEENPSMLDIEELRAAVAEAGRVLPTLDIQIAMASDPQVILGFQRGAQLIPYDPPTPEPDDDEYAAYYN